ncbi:SMP-30/gluconolactonase/LRE family protein [Egicoccus sp. AB-alg6-2]|uniref:SMP-30/gluconolactonase/LRE family protein n=1 Tax=Egicoccus sp. AB-alg6-2 TaxID=3242692 RepID=UPI00359DB2C5
MTRTLTAHLANDHRADLAEGPLWDEAGNRLLYVDIEGGDVLAHGPDDGSTTVLLDHDDVVSAVLRHVGGTLLLGLRDGLAVWDESAPDAPPRLVVPLQSDEGELRCNDGTVGPDGAVWLGTMHLDEATGRARLFRIGPHGADQRRDGLTVSNGVGFSPDGRVLYHADTPTGRIDALTLGPGGEVVEVRPFAEIPAGAGQPDGLTVDAEGGVWAALWSGAAVWHFTPDGALASIVEVPASHTTSCTFGGADLSTLWITTGGPHVGGEGDGAGGLFTVQPGVRGLPTPVATCPLPR